MAGKLLSCTDTIFFEQERFKKDFILMNQKARQESKNKIERDFCKLLNNANFGDAITVTFLKKK